MLWGEEAPFDVYKLNIFDETPFSVNPKKGFGTLETALLLTDLLLPKQVIPELDFFRCP